MPQALFQSILIVTHKDHHAKWDQEALKKLKVPNVTLAESGRVAFAHLKKNRVDMVLCDTVLEDIDGVTLVRELRKHEEFKRVPIIMVTTENRMERVLDAISAGVSGYILRPYSFETFERHLRMAHHTENFMEIEEIQLEEAQSMIEQGDFDDAIEALEEIVNTQDEAQKYYDMGCNSLRLKKYGQAIISFKKAVKLNDLFAEAYHGLAQAYEQKGDLDNCKLYLHRAAEVLAEQDRFEDTKRMFIEILKLEDDPTNPFNTLGVKLRKKGDYVQALYAYERAVELTPDDENVYYNIARAHYFMNDIPKAEENLVVALSMNGGFSEALALYADMTGKEWVPKGGKKKTTAPTPKDASTLDL